MVSHGWSGQSADCDLSKSGLGTPSITLDTTPARHARRHQSVRVIKSERWDMHPHG